MDVKWFQTDICRTSIVGLCMCLICCGDSSTNKTAAVSEKLKSSQSGEFFTGDLRQFQKWLTWGGEESIMIRAVGFKLELPPEAAAPFFKAITDQGFVRYEDDEFANQNARAFFRKSNDWQSVANERSISWRLHEAEFLLPVNRTWKRRRWIGISSDSSVTKVYFLIIEEPVSGK